MGQQSSNASNKAPEIAELVNEHINNLDDKGKLQLPDDMPEWQQHVIRSEKRQRDAQAELSKTQSKLRTANATNDVLMETASGMVPSDYQLSDAELIDLDTLKKTDPDKYRLRVNALEATAKEAQKTKLEELTGLAVTKAQTAYTNKSRSEVLSEFRVANPALVITDDVLVNDVPPRFLNGVNSGEVSYAQYLEDVKAYLTTDKRVASGSVGDPNNLSSQPGSRTPGKGAAKLQGDKDYAKMTL